MRNKFIIHLQTNSSENKKIKTESHRPSTILPILPFISWKKWREMFFFFFCSIARRLWFESKNWIADNTDPRRLFQILAQTSAIFHWRWNLKKIQLHTIILNQRNGKKNMKKLETRIRTCFMDNRYHREFRFATHVFIFFFFCGLPRHLCSFYYSVDQRLFACLLLNIFFFYFRICSGIFSPFIRWQIS